MKFGICGYLTAKNADGCEFDLPAKAKALGFDYVELPLAVVAGLSEAEFGHLRAALEKAAIPCEACNIMFPRSVRLTGPKVYEEQVMSYLELAMGRAAGLGVRVVVFGSAGARNVPEGFPKEQAWLQLVEMLRIASEISSGYEISIAIEPLNTGESNILNTASEAFALARLVESAHVGLLVDYYHMALEQEDPGILLTARQSLRHVHFADPEERAYPAEIKSGFVEFFGKLKKAGYNERVSLEAGFRDFEVEAKQALALLNSLTQ